MKIVLIILFSFLTLLGYSQNEGKNIFNKLNETSGGDIKIYQSPQLRLIMEKHLESIENKKGVKGYRIQIYFGTGKNARSKTNEVRISFVQTYKNTPAHIIYDNPYFRVKVGDFRTKSEALYFLNKIKPDYPDAFIVPDIIEIKTNKENKI